jgi:hypothetical protein
MNRYVTIFLLLIWICVCTLPAQTPAEAVPEQAGPVNTGFGTEAVATGYISAPSVLGLMFISSLVSEWNAGYFGIPATALILASPPLIYAGGRSIRTSPEIHQPRARIGWTLYGLSIIPTALALYGFTTDWGANLPLTLASGILGAGSIIAMTTYASGRLEMAQSTNGRSGELMQIGIIPIRGGAIATLSFRF